MLLTRQGQHLLSKVALRVLVKQIHQPQHDADVAFDQRIAGLCHVAVAAGQRVGGHLIVNHAQRVLLRHLGLRRLELRQYGLHVAHRADELTNLVLPVAGEGLGQIALGDGFSRHSDLLYRLGHHAANQNQPDTGDQGHNPQPQRRIGIAQAVDLSRELVHVGTARHHPVPVFQVDVGHQLVAWCGLAKFFVDPRIPDDTGFLVQDFLDELVPVGVFGAQNIFARQRRVYHQITQIRAWAGIQHIKVARLTHLEAAYRAFQ